MCKHNLISDPVSRSIRKHQKSDLILKFLRQHIWSSQKILQEVMGLASRQATHKSLIALEKQGLLRRHTFDALGGNLTIWGITHQGQAHAFQLGRESLINAYFEPSRVSEQTIRHQLDVQKLRLTAEKNGWSNWVDGDRLDALDKNQKRPDAIAHDPLGHIIAIECERSFKSLKRYEQILIQYLKWLKSGEINAVIWVSPTAEIAKRLKVILKSISSVQISGQKVLIEPERHHLHLHFCSYDDWPSYE